MTWRDWYETLGRQWHELERTLSADSYQLLMNATLAGQGISLGWTRLLARELAEGQLVKACDEEVESRGRLSLFTPEGRRDSGVAALFRRWLVDAFDQL